MRAIAFTDSSFSLFKISFENAVFFIFGFSYLDKSFSRARVFKLLSFLGAQLGPNISFTTTV